MSTPVREQETDVAIVAKLRAVELRKEARKRR